jgi:hypothetical protein
MSHRTISRLIAGIIMAIVVASAINIDHLRRNRLGRDAFMQHESDRYDRFFAHPDLQESVLESLLLCGSFLLIYELIAFNCLKVLKVISEAKPKADDPSAQ